MPQSKAEIKSDRHMERYTQKKKSCKLFLRGANFVIFYVNSTELLHRLDDQFPIFIFSIYIFFEITCEFNSKS